MFVRTSTETDLLRKATHPSVFFFHFCRKEKEGRKKKKKKNPQSLWEERGGCQRKGKEDAAMKGPLGPSALFPLRGACYWCKMALCLSETPASWTELPWSNALLDRSGWFLSTFFDCLLLKMCLHCSWYCGVCLTGTVSVALCFKL